MQNLYEITGYDKCYLWIGNADGPLKGVITTKRYPSSMTMDDIIGEYLIDSDNADDDYAGLENLLSPSDGWWGIVNSSNDNVLKLSWYDSGTYDTFYFSEVLTDDNYCLSFNEFKTIWYEKSGYNQSFHPTNFDVDTFDNLLGLWGDLDSNFRMLWNDEYSSNYIYYSDIGEVYPISGITEGSDDIYLYKKDNLSKNQLIRYKDIPNFELFNLKIDGLILHPTYYPNVNTVRLQYVMPAGNGSYYIVKSSEEIYTDNEIVNTYDNIYYSDLDYSSDKNKPESMYLTLQGSFYRRFSEDNDFKPINVTFANGYTYPFNVTSESNNYGNTGASYTVILNGEWRSSSQSNPNSSLYEGVYESYSNYNIANREAIMYIDVKGYSTFTIYIRSYAESTWDYMMVSQLDKIISGSTSTGVNVKAHTSGNQQSGTAIGNYSKVVYDIPNDGYSHRIQIVYRKDGSQNKGNDRGYLLIQKSNPIAPASENIVNTISARCDNTENFSLSQIGTVTAIDYSNLYFSEINTAPVYYLGSINLDRYWIGTGINMDNCIYFNDSTIRPENDFICNMLSLDGSQIISSSNNGTYFSSTRRMEIRYTANLIGKEFYVKVPFFYNNVVQYICFRVLATDTGFINICNNIGDCTLWLDNMHSNTKIWLHNNSSGSIYIYPIGGDYTNGRLVDGYLHTALAHGCFNSSATSYFKLTYSSSNGYDYSTDEEIYVDHVCSLISPRCVFLNELWDYMNSSPMVYISKYE